MEKHPVKRLIEEKRVVNINEVHQANRTLGETLSDILAQRAGSWGFILSFMFLLVAWIFFNSLLLKTPLDPYPFILLNLILSCIAALQAPIIMMSQRRQEQKDRLRSEQDYLVDQKSEQLLEEVYLMMLELKRDVDEIKSSR